jgi:tRNA G10  N-methylase Trm11
MPVVAAQQTNLFEPQALEGVHGTFELAKQEPVHGWYAYLEGYSAAFVDSLRTKYMPVATRIIDPFAGTGTSPLTLGWSDVECGYCEVNPVMARVIQTKVAALRLARAQRVRVSERLLELSNSLRDITGASSPADDLRTSYRLCFGDSRFFVAGSFEDVLRLRSACDSEIERDRITGDLVTLAVIANLVQCSLLKRAGDVRYRTEAELKKGVPPVLDSVAQHISRIARDLMFVPQLQTPPTLLAMDARDLRGAPSFKADGVITSPPYLNGTNYIRNTKLELWFLREILDSEGLRSLRDRVVTSGICDVLASKTNEVPHPTLAPVLHKLSRNAYDRRIPKMVASYFADMRAVLQGLWHQTNPGAVICIDIGDSRYGAVNVPTQDILSAIAESVGFTLVEKLPLRQRVSKDGSKLSQYVLILRRESGGQRLRAAPQASVTRQERWRWFREVVPHQQSPYDKRNWGHPLHSACSYQGKMKPSLAHFLVHCFSEPGQTVLDPFSGAGTIPFEGALQGRRAFGFDISVMACAVTRAKLTIPNRSALNDLIQRLGRAIDGYKPTPKDIEDAAEVSFNRPVPEYFHPSTLREVLAARHFLLNTRNESSEWAFAMAAMLHILHGNRPYALSRRSHPVTPFAPTGPAEYRPLIPRLQDKINRMLETSRPPEFREGRVYLMDLLAEWPDDCKQIDAIITSPPFFDSTRFYMTNWMRYWFSGWERKDFDDQPKRFVESLQRESLSIYKDIFRRFRQNLNTNGVVVLHLGQSRKCDMAAELVLRAKDFFSVEAVFAEDVTHCEKHGVRDKGTVTAHQYVVLKAD